MDSSNFLPARWRESRALSYNCPGTLSWITAWPPRRSCPRLPLARSELKKRNLPSTLPPPAEGLRGRTATETNGVARLLAAGDYARLKARLSTLRPAVLGSEWAALPPLQKLAVFKLLGPVQAMEFFSSISFEDKYLVFCGFEPGAIAPLTEVLSPAKRSLFEKLDADAYREMLRRLGAPGPGAGASTA